MISEGGYFSVADILDVSNDNSSYPGSRYRVKKVSERVIVKRYYFVFLISCTKIMIFYVKTSLSRNSNSSNSHVRLVSPGPDDALFPGDNLSL